MKSIVVDSAYQNTVDNNGETLIPPTLKSFASTFSADLLSSLDLKVPVTTSKSAGKNSIFLTLGNSSDYLDAAGRPTSEGYSIQVTAQGIVITGASPLGIWWGTRSILQQGVLSEKLSLGSATDSPGWGIRGTFVSLQTPFSTFTEAHISPVGRRQTLLPTRIHHRDMFLPVVLQAKHPTFAS